MLTGLLFYGMMLVFVCNVFFLSKNSVSLKCPITTAGTGLSVGGRAIAREHAGTCPNVRMGAIDRAPGNKIFPLKRAMSH